MKKIFLLLWLLVAQAAFATTYHVSKFNTCTGSTPCSDSNNGTSAATAFLTINKCATVATTPGDNCLIYGDTLIPGTQYTESITIAGNGAAGNVITFKPETATGTVFLRHPSNTEIAGNAVINGNGKRYIRIEGITFKNNKTGTTIQAFDTNAAVNFNTVDTVVYGWEIVGNTFDNCGPSALDPVTTSQIYISRVRDFLIDQNTFTNSAGFMLNADHSYRCTFSNNIITGQRKHRPSWDPNPQSAVSWQNGTCCAAPGSTLKDGGYFTYSDNIISGATAGQKSNGFRLDAGAHNTTFLRNIISGSHFGIFLEAGVNLCLVQENIVYNGQDVIISGSTYHNVAFSTAGINSSNGNNNDVWINNVAYNNNQGFLLRQTTNSVLKNNISVNNLRTQFSVVAGFNNNPSFKNNLSWKTGAVQGSTSIDNWNCAPGTNPQNDSGCFYGNTAADDTFNAWVSLSGETGAVFGDPLFVHPDSATFDFHLQGGSPAIGAGLAGVDIGAYPTGGGTTPIVISIVQVVGGTVFQSHAVVTIAWTTNGVGNVVIELSRNSGTSWEVITASSPNSGTYAWTTTGAGTNNRIRVTSIEDATVTDATDSDFTIQGIFRIAKAS